MEKNQMLLILAAIAGIAAFVVYNNSQVISPAVTAASTEQAKILRVIDIKSLVS